MHVYTIYYPNKLMDCLKATETLSLKNPCPFRPQLLSWVSLQRLPSKMA